MHTFAKAYLAEPFMQQPAAQISWFHHCLTQGGPDYPVFVGLECPVSVLQCQRLSKRQRFFVIFLWLSAGRRLPRYRGACSFYSLCYDKYSIFPTLLLEIVIILTFSCYNAEVTDH
jgi:hypothetical protein